MKNLLLLLLLSDSLLPNEWKLKIEVRQEQTQSEYLTSLIHWENKLFDASLLTIEHGWKYTQLLPDGWISRTWEPVLFSNKVKNKAMKSYNGNIKTTINVIHWNMGNTYWIHKTDEIEAAINEYSPDLFYISEANIF